MQHNVNDYGHGTPLNPKSRTGVLVCHKELGLGILLQVYENRMDDAPVTLATVCFNQQEQHVVDCDLADLTTSFVALSTIPVLDESDLGPRRAPPGELITFDLTENDSFDVVFHPSGVWWCGNTLDEIRNDMPYAEAFMSAEAAVAAGRALPDVFRPEIIALRRTMLDVLYDHLDDIDEEVGTIDIPKKLFLNLQDAGTAAGIAVDESLLMVMHLESDEGPLVRLRLDEVDALAARLGMGERLMEDNQKALAVACQAAAEERNSKSDAAPSP